MSEHEHQATVIEWANLQSRTVPELALLFAIPNGGGRGKSFITKKGVKLPPLNAIRLQKEGLKAGVPDLFLPVMRNGLGGLFIEMKDGERKSSALTSEQLIWHASLIHAGYKVITCWSADEAIRELSDYLGLKGRLWKR